MAAIDIINLALGLMTTAFGAAKNAGVIGSPEWLKYADAGLFIATKLQTILPDVFADPAKYDNMTAGEIQTLLTPTSWEDLEARARAELGMPPATPSA